MVDIRRMTDRSKKVMFLAESQAKQWGLEAVEPEHVLLGLAQEGTGVAANVLKSLGADYKRLVETSALPWREPAANVYWSMATDQLIESAMEEARHLGHNYIGTEHLLLAVCRLTEGNALHLLAQCGIQQAEVRLEVLNLLGYGPRERE